MRRHSLLSSSTQGAHHTIFIAFSFVCLVCCSCTCSRRIIATQCTFLSATSCRYYQNRASGGRVWAADAAKLRAMVLLLPFSQPSRNVSELFAPPLSCYWSFRFLGLDRMSLPLTRFRLCVVFFSLWLESGGCGQVLQPLAPALKANLFRRHLRSRRLPFRELWPSLLGLGLGPSDEDMWREACTSLLAKLASRAASAAASAPAAPADAEADPDAAASIALAPARAAGGGFGALG